MTRFSDILLAHGVAEKAMLDQIDQAVDAGDVAHLQGLSSMLEVNNNAYYVLLIARFEDAVRGLSKTVIDLMRRQGGGNVSRAWYVVRDDDRVFMNHVALLTDKGSSDYRDIKELYDVRNAIAHSSFAETKPNVPAIADKLSGILSRLEGTP